MTHFTTRCNECRKAYLIDRGYLLRTIQRLEGALAAQPHGTRGSSSR
jgi:hypothetical protein